MNRQRNNNYRHPSPLLSALGIHLLSALSRSEYKPPVTIGLLLLNIWVHVSQHPFLFGYYLSDIHQNCLRPDLIISRFVNHGELMVNRLLLSSVIHVDDAHLYFNMVSLCWKGIHLEKEMGSVRFLKLVIYSVVTSHLLVVLSALALDLLDCDKSVSGMQSCAVGFSAVLFSLKYVWNVDSSGQSFIYGLSVPTKYAAWLELVVISIVTPNASFVGHLAGILSGYFYVRCLKHTALFS